LFGESGGSPALTMMQNSIPQERQG
jgi:hypothetical protein